jgi:hypothetical protein
VGPYGENHSTGASWVVRRAYAEKNTFDKKAVKGEEGSFMRNWRTKMAMIEPEDCILVMGHAENTVDKSMQWFKSAQVWDQFRSTFAAVLSAKPQGST